MKKPIVIFDLDETVIDSRHRTPNNHDGTLNLAAYVEKHTPENVARDTLLPLARVMQSAYESCEVWICTARDMMQCDYDFLARHGLRYHKIFSRDQVKSQKHYHKSDGLYKKHWLSILNLRQYRGRFVAMFDDAKPVISTMRQMGIVCINAHKANRRLANV